MNDIYSIDYKEAMRILNIESLSDITEKSIKEAWRQRIKRVHPDLALGDKIKKKELERQAKLVNEAYEILGKMAKSLSASSLSNKKEGDSYEICVIDLDGLQKIYSGQVIISKILINNIEKEVEVNKSNIRSKKRVIIQIPYTVHLEGSEWTDIAYCTWNIKDNYSFLVQIPDIEEKMSLSVSIMQKKIKFSTDKKTIRLNFNFDYGISISVQIERVIKNDG